MPASYRESKSLFERSKKCIAGGVNSQSRSYEQPHPLFFKSGSGCRLLDVDGNQYIDYVMARGPLIFGHSPPFLLEAVRNGIAPILMSGSQHTLEVEVAEAVQRMVPCAKLVRLAGSGTEAVHAALRLARGFTGRCLIVRFEGTYHGWSDSALAGVLRPGAGNAPMSAGIASALADDVLILPWNDIEAVRRTFAERAHEIAAVITEPILCNVNCIMPKPDYLRALRDLCSAHGSLLIFDEVITGFRVHPGGAQALFGITPDLATFAKAMGGGFPIAMICGREDVMQTLASGKVLHMGTYNANMVGIAACHAALGQLTVEALSEVNRKGLTLIHGFHVLEEKHNLGLVAQGPGAVFAVSFTGGCAVTDYRSHMAHADEAMYSRFVRGLMQRGVRFEKTNFLSTAHTEFDIQATLQAADSTMAEMKQESRL